MTFLGQIISTPGALDAFGRVRVSNPHTLWDSKLTVDAAPLLWDDAETSGSGTSSSHSTDRASVTMSVGATTVGTRVRQTYQHIGYEPGKSQFILMTGILGAGATGITRRIGSFNENNGLFFQLDDNTLSVVIRSHVTGSPVDEVITQANWNFDKFDGTGPSGITLDTSTIQIFAVDYEWLGAGRVRFGFFEEGQFMLAHHRDYSNDATSVYMSTPNLPLRYEISNDGTGAASDLECICSSVMSEGGDSPIGSLRYASTDGNHVDANSVGTVYAVVGLRLKTSALGCRIDPVMVSLLAETADDFEWIIFLNPTVNGTFTYTSLASDSCLEVARGATANTITGGTPLVGGWIANASAESIQGAIDDSAVKLGSAIDGTRSTLVLACRPLSSNLDIQGSITFREIQ